MVVMKYVVTNEVYTKHIVDMNYFKNALSFDRYLQLIVHNQGSATTYYKLVSEDENWSVSTPTNGELGSVGAGSMKRITSVVTRSTGIPSAPSTETLNLKIEAYSDTAYSVKAGEASFDLAMYYVDSSSEASVLKWDFDDGTTQGWTLGSRFSLSDTYSLGGGGYSAYISVTTGNNQNISYTDSMSISGVTLPATSKVFWFVHFLPRSSPGSSGVEEMRITLKVNGIDKFSYFTDIGDASVLKGKWSQIGIDISEHAGQTVGLEIEAYVHGDDYSWVKLYIDDIVIVGTDLL